MSARKGTCIDCEPAPTIHIMEKCGAIMKTCIEPLMQSFALEQYLEAVIDPIATYTAKMCIYALTKTRLATIIDEPDKHTPLRTRCVWECAIRRGIPMYEIRPLGRAIDLYEYEHKGTKRLFKSLPRPKSTYSSDRCYTSIESGLEWMDNKSELRKRFAAAGIPMAKGGVGRTWEEVKKIFHSLPSPVITKPHIGSRGRHTTTRIATENELRVGFEKAKKLSPWIIVEQEFLGTLYRVLLIDGSVVAVLRRDRAHVVGDGLRTVRALVDKENQNPRRDSSEFCKLATDDAATHELARQNFTWESVPKMNEVVYLSRKPSRSVGGSTIDVRDVVHPENIKLFEHIARTVNDPLIGVDFFISDIAKPWNMQECAGVIECNSLPFIDLHHYPLYGPIRDAAGALWDAVLKKT